MRRPPAELALQLGRVDGVAAVVAGAVGDPVEVLGVAAHGSEYHAQDGDVVLLPIGADEVGLPHLALGEDVSDGRGVVLAGRRCGSRRGPACRRTPWCSSTGCSGDTASPR